MNASRNWVHRPAAKLDRNAKQAAEARQAALTKPPGALGRLENLAIQLAAMQGVQWPAVERIHICIFAADHGVAAEGVSAFSQAVTAEMLCNFSRGGAAICVLAREIGAALEVINLGVVNDPGPLAGILDLRLGPGTANFVRAPAMSEEQLMRALEAGRGVAERAQNSGAQLFIGGEMGIANTTTAAALACVLLQAVPQALVGPGTGLDARGVAHKARVVQRALQRHEGYLSDPLEALRRLGGFEIAALAGAYIRCAQLSLPLLVDGFISSVAALCAVKLCEGAGDWMIFAHRSTEPGHARVLEALGATALFDLHMGLGEGSGAAVAVPLLKLACALHKDMATFTEAHVSERL